MYLLTSTATLHVYVVLATESRLLTLITVREIPFHWEKLPPLWLFPSIHLVSIKIAASIYIVSSRVFLSVCLGQGIVSSDWIFGHLRRRANLSACWILMNLEINEFKVECPYCLYMGLVRLNCRAVRSEFLVVMNSWVLMMDHTLGILDIPFWPPEMLAMVRSELIIYDDICMTGDWIGFNQINGGVGLLMAIKVPNFSVGISCEYCFT